MTVIAECDKEAFNAVVLSKKSGIARFIFIKKDRRDIKPESGVINHNRPKGDRLPKATPKEGTK
jgi:hypothetical protein